MQRGARKKKACEILKIGYTTFLNWERRYKEGKSLKDKRSVIEKNPKNKLKEKERKKIVKVCCNKKYKDDPIRQIVIDLLDKGRYIASASTFRRVLKANNLATHREESKVRKDNKDPGRHKADGPNQVWSWDISYLKTKVNGIHYYLYLMMDIWDRRIVGFSIEKRESGRLAKKLLNKVMSKLNVEGVILHSDNGGPMISADMYSKMEEFNITPSHSRPRVSNDNAYSESLFRTIKYDSGYPLKFKNLKSAKEWMTVFVHWYNNNHRHSGIGYVTPLERHKNKDKEIFENRNKVMEEARKNHPTRFGDQKKVWNKKEIVKLNPRKEDCECESNVV